LRSARAKTKTIKDEVPRASRRAETKRAAEGEKTLTA
jgi:hypothetical protein